MKRLRTKSPAKAPTSPRRRRVDVPLDESRVHDNLLMLASVASKYLKQMQTEQEVMPGTSVSPTSTASPPQDVNSEPHSFAVPSPVTPGRAKRSKPKATIKKRSKYGQRKSHQVTPDSAERSQPIATIKQRSPSAQPGPSHQAIPDSANRSEPKAEIKQSLRSGQRQSHQVTPDSANRSQPVATIKQSSPSGQRQSHQVTPDDANRSQPQATITPSSPSAQPGPSYRHSHQQEEDAWQEGSGGLPNQPNGNLPTQDENTPQQPEIPSPLKNKPPNTSFFTCPSCMENIDLFELYSRFFRLHMELILQAALPYRCSTCNGYFRTEKESIEHMLTAHQEFACMPIVNLKQPGVTDLLADLGVEHFLSVSQIPTDMGAIINSPIFSVPSASNAAQDNLGPPNASGADGRV